MFLRIKKIVLTKRFRVDSFEHNAGISQKSRKRGCHISMELLVSEFIFCCYFGVYAKCLLQSGNAVLHQL